MEQNQRYQRLVERISKETGIEINEVERMIDAKRAKLSNLISKEGAAQVVAAELNVKLDRERVKIDEILSGMRKIIVEGKIIRIFPVRTFKTKTSESKVVSFVLADETGNIRCVLWDTNHIKLIEEGKIKEGSVVELKNATVRENGPDYYEVHLGSQGELLESKAKMENVVMQMPVSTKTISELKENVKAKVRATIVQMFEPKFFSVCPECNGKVSQENGKFACVKHGAVVPAERAVVTIIIDDGTGNTRATCFFETAKKLFEVDSIEKLKNSEEMSKKKNDILGEEFYFTGTTKKNAMYNNIDFVINELNVAEADDIIREIRDKTHVEIIRAE